MKKIKWIHWSWLALTLIFLFFRFQNLQGIFTSDGVIVNDTDPYYRLHRIDLMLNEHTFYPLHEDHLDYPKGIDVSWPLGLDLLVALPLKLYHSTTHAEIESYSAIIIPFLSLPLLWFSGWIGTFLGGPLFGLLVGLLITCSSTLIYQTGIGRLDHHFLEAMFPILLLMFLLKYLETKEKFAWIGIIFILSFAPSFAPQGWILGACMTIAFMWDKKWDFAHDVSKIFCWSFFISLILLSFSDRFSSGFIHWGSFSWWTPFVYLLAACFFEIISILRQSSSTCRKYKILIGFCFLIVTSFLIYKNNLGFFSSNIKDAIGTVTVKTKTMATTLEARSPFDISEEMWKNSDMCILIAALLCFLFFLFKRRFTFLIGYTFIPFLLCAFQIRFATMALPLLFIIVLLFFKGWVEKIKVEPKTKIGLLIAITILLIIPYRPTFGFTDIENSHFYFRPIRSFSLFLNDDFKNRNVKKDNQAIIAHWDYGHWLLYYTGLPVIADPFQGPSAYEVLELFTSKGTDQLQPFLERHPSKYLVIESGAQRSLHWLESVHKDTSIYFEKMENSPGDKDYFRTTRAFEDLFMYRFFFELGRGLDNNHPKDWRLIYISPFSSPVENDISALKVFEHVPGLSIHAHSQKPYPELYLQAQVGENGEALVYQQITKGKNDFYWTVPYGKYDKGGVQFDGSYVIRDSSGKVLKKITGVTEDQVLQGDKLEVRF